MKKLNFNNKDACLIKDELTGKYLTNLSLDEGYLIVADKMTFFVDARCFSQSKVNYEKIGIETRLLSDFNDIKEFLISLKTENLYIDFSRTTIKEYNFYKQLGFNIKDAEKDIILSRAIKRQEEIENIKKACKIAQNAYYSAIKSIEIGMTERELKSKIEQKILEFDGEGSSFDIIVAFGKNSAIPHHKTSDEKLKENMPILIDMGAIYNGYMSDITRIAYFGNPTEKFVKLYNEVLKANLLATENIKCGMKTNVADALARDSLKNAGLDKYFTHSLGHGIGLEIHEYPTLSFKKQDTLKENMIFSIEPGIYLEGEFGIRIEDTVLLTKNGIERLFSDSKELLILPIK